jgi:transcriptional regulator with XRE-family HTH domain
LSEYVFGKKSTVNSTLFLFRQYRNWQESDVSNGLSISMKEYNDLECGNQDVDVETALRLSELYFAPPELFLSKKSSSHFSIIYSQCHFQNSNGYVNNLCNESESILKAKDEMIQSLKEEVELLRKLNDRLIASLKT